MNNTVMNGAAFNSFYPPVAYTSEFAEAAFTLSPGVNNLRPKVRGNAFVLVLENKSTDGNWAVEEINVIGRDAGRRRV